MRQSQFTDCGMNTPREIELRMAVRGIHVPKDILVVSPAEFEARKEIVGTLPYAASREGRALYVRPV